MYKKPCLLCVILLLIGWYGLPAQMNTDESTMIEFQNLLTDSLGFEIMGIHSVTLRDSTKTGEFEEFIKNNYSPLSEGSLLGTRSFILKADRNTKIGDYLFICLFNTESVRDFYYPEEGKGLSEEGRKLFNETGIHAITRGSMEYGIFKWEGFYKIVQ